MRIWANPEIPPAMTSEPPRDQPKPSGLNFSLPDLPRPTKAALPVSTEQLLLGIGALAALNLVVTLFARPSGNSEPARPSTVTLIDAEALKKLALKLEQQGLSGPAATAWNEYLSAARPEAKEAAGIYYRIGKAHQEAHDYEAALEAYYRAEALPGGSDGSELATDLGRRIGESLEAMGRFAALRHELSGRVALDSASSTSGQVVAEIGTEKITEADLDRKIEERIEGELARFGGRLDEAEKTRQKEAMLSQFGGKEARLQFLQQLIAEEVLYRKARQIELAEKPEVRRQLEESRRSFLARLVLQRRVEDYAKISEDEVKARYEANKESLRIPESFLVSRIVFPSAEAAQTRIAAGSEGTDWEELAEPLVKGQPVPGLKRDAKLDALWATAPKSVAAEAFPAEDGSFHVYLVRERKESRIPPYEEVAQRLAQETQRAKEERVQGELLEQLRREFDVVLHLDRFGKPEGEAKAPQTQP